MPDRLFVGGDSFSIFAQRSTIHCCRDCLSLTAKIPPLFSISTHHTSQIDTDKKQKLLLSSPGEKESK